MSDVSFSPRWRKCTNIVKLCYIPDCLLTSKLLSHSSLLQQHMAYRCTIRKHGTLLYRQGGDLVHALTVALGQGNTTLQSIDDNATCMRM